MWGHSGPVQSVAWSPDGGYLVSGSSDNLIMVWNGSNGDLITTLDEHSAGVHSIRFSHTGPFMASKSWDNSIRLWHTNSWECKAIVDETSSRGTPPPAFHPTGPVLATVGKYDTEVHIWRLDLNLLLTHNQGI